MKFVANPTDLSICQSQAPGWFWPGKFSSPSLTMYLDYVVGRWRNSSLGKVEQMGLLALDAPLFRTKYGSAATGKPTGNLLSVKQWKSRRDSQGDSNKEFPGQASSGIKANNKKHSDWAEARLFSSLLGSVSFALFSSSGYPKILAPESTAQRCMNLDQHCKW